MRGARRGVEANQAIQGTFFPGSPSTKKRVRFTRSFIAAQDTNINACTKILAECPAVAFIFVF